MDHPTPTVAILGASPDPERTSNLAVRRYLDAGWRVWPVHPRAEVIHEQVVYRRLEDLPGRPDIVSLYLRSERALELVDAIRAAAPDWVYCNPGADDPELVAALRAAGLRPVVACNLVALAQGDPRELARRHATN